MSLLFRPSCSLASSRKWDESRLGRCVVQTNELVVSLNVFISTSADKQSPGARTPPTSHPYRQLRTLNKEGHFVEGGGDTQERDTLQGRGGAGTLVGNKTIHVRLTYMDDGEILQNSNADNKCLNGVNLQK